MNYKFWFLILLFQFNYGQSSVNNQELLNSCCNCINKIDINLETKNKNDSIRSCILTNNIVFLIKESMLAKKDNDSLKNVIVADKNYKIIEKKLLEECVYLKKLLMYDSNKFEHSISDNEKAMSHYELGVAYFRKENYTKAIKEYEKSVKLDKNFAFAWDNMGICYRKLNKFEEAIKCYEKSLELDPKGNMPLMNMAVAYEFLKKYQPASETYQKLINYYPNEPEGYYGIARMFVNLEKYEEATDNIFQAYLIYKESNSPYIHDAEKVISLIFSQLQKLEKTEVLFNIAKKYKINLQ